MRPQTACIVCRKRRRKCRRSRQGTSCDFCIERSIPCEASPETVLQRDGYETIIPRQEHAMTHKFNLLPAKDLSEELIESYFRHIHVSFHVLFHRPSFLSAFRDGSLPRILLFGVIGLSARFSHHEALAAIPPRERGRPYTKEAERLLNLHNTSLVTIQACLLLGAASIAEGEGATESIYFSIACRMAMLLDLPNARVATRIEQEVNNRVWWTLYETDTWSSTGVRLPKLMPLRNVPLPMAEHKFLQLSLTASPFLNISPYLSHHSDLGSTMAALYIPDDSLLAHSVALNQIFSQIDKLNSQAVSGGLKQAGLIQEVERISLEMGAWASELPEQMRNTPENLAYWTTQGSGNIFVLLHIQYHHFSQLLFYQFLHGSADPTCHSSANYRYAQKCRQHATNLCNLIHLANDTPDTEPLFSLVGHVLTIASTAQLHILLFDSDAAEIENARRLLERNFEFLTLLRTYWPCVDASFSRFEAFHTACLRCQDDSQFQMDQWMLKFMLEFAATVNERKNYESSEDSFHGEWSLSSIGVL